MELLDGLDIVMLLTGLYAIPPALELAEKRLVIHSKQLAIGEETERFRWRSLIPTWIRSVADRHRRRASFRRWAATSRR